MAIAFDSANTDTNANSTVGATNTITINHTPAGANRVLYIVIFLRDATTGDKAISSITYGGSATGITVVNTAVSNNRGRHIYRLIAPATGANAIVITTAGTCDRIVAHSFSFTGVDQTTPEDGVTPTGTGGASATTTAPTLTSISDNDWWLGGVELIIGTQRSITLSASPDPPTPVKVKDSILTAAINNINYSIAYAGAVTPAGIITPTWSWTTGVEFGAFVLVMKPAAAAGSANRRVIMVS